MGRKPIIVTAIVALGTIGAASAIHATQSSEHGWFDRAAYFGEDGHHQYAGMGRRGHRGHRFMMKRICGPEREERIDDVLNLVESFVQMNPTQLSAWNALAKEVRASNEPVERACTTLKAEGESTSLPARISRMETLLGTGYELVQRIRPKFESFYETLSPEQQKALDRMTKRHRHGHKHLSPVAHDL